MIDFGHIAERAGPAYADRLAAVRPHSRDQRPGLAPGRSTFSALRARGIGVSVVVRGLRALTDFSAEFDMALMNNKMAPDIDAIYFMPRARYLYISASRIRELAGLKQSVEDLVPSHVARALEARFGPPQTALGVRGRE